MQIKLERGTISFDKCDMKVYDYHWYIASNGYAASMIRGKQVYMHRFILGKTGKSVDHRDGNKLNNRRDNLVVCTQSINMFNKRTKKHTSNYRGVSWDKSRKSWKAVLMKDKKQIFLGRFNDELSADKAYRAAAQAVYGFLPYEISREA